MPNGGSATIEHPGDVEDATGRHQWESQAAKHLSTVRKLAGAF
jgi:hypothetical protein